MSTYNEAELRTIGDLMRIDTGGLVPAPVARLWAGYEQGIHNNPFGWGAPENPGYPYLAAGVAAAASGLMTSPAYARTRAELRAAAGDLDRAATAIARSPWRLGAAGLAAAGGLDPEYAAVFRRGGLHVPPVLSPSEGDRMLTITLERHHVVAGAPFFDTPGGAQLGTFGHDFDVTALGTTPDGRYKAVLTSHGGVLPLTAPYVRSSDLGPPTVAPAQGWAAEAIADLETGGLDADSSSPGAAPAPIGGWYAVLTLSDGSLLYETAELPGFPLSAPEGSPLQDVWQLADRDRLPASKTDSNGTTLYLTEVGRVGGPQALTYSATPPAA